MLHLCVKCGQIFHLESVPFLQTSTHTLLADLSACYTLQNVAQICHLPFPCIFWPYFYIIILETPSSWSQGDQNTRNYRIAEKRGGLPGSRSLYLRSCYICRSTDPKNSITKQFTFRSDCLRSLLKIEHPRRGRSQCTESSCVTWNKTRLLHIRSLGNSNVSIECGPKTGYSVILFTKY